MQILCHRKDRKVGKEIKMLGRGGGKNIKLGWGIYTPVNLTHLTAHIMPYQITSCTVAKMTTVNY